MENKYVIFIDIDGTWTSGGKTDPENIIAVEKARSEGHYVFFNTGRSKAWIDPTHLENTPHDGLISGLGSLIEAGGKTVFERPVPTGFVFACIERFAKSSGTLLICGDKKVFSLNPLPYFKKYNVIEIKTAEDYKNTIGNEKIQKLEFFDVPVSDADRQFLKTTLNIYDFGDFKECCHKSCSKSGAMDIVLKFLKIDAKNSIAIGDSINDIDMLKKAGIAVAIGNAADPVKEIADFISTDCDSGGVAYAINKIIFE